MQLECAITKYKQEKNKNKNLNFTFHYSLFRILTQIKLVVSLERKIMGEKYATIIITLLRESYRITLCCCWGQAKKYLILAPFFSFLLSTNKTYCLSTDNHQIYMSQMEKGKYVSCIRKINIVVFYRLYTKIYCRYYLK